jgi:hypothetical protein
MVMPPVCTGDASVRRREGAATSRSRKGISLPGKSAGLRDSLPRVAICYARMARENEIGSAEPKQHVRAEEGADDGYRHTGSYNRSVRSFACSGRGSTGCCEPAPLSPGAEPEDIWRL